MGQQQLLLIVLGVIIVGIAVVVGINVFTASSLEANRNAVVADLTTLASMAQQHYRKPAAMGGGGNTFDGFTVPAQLQQTANMGAAVNSAGVSGAGPCTLVGTMQEEISGGGVITVTMSFDEQAIISTIFSDATVTP